MTEFINLFEKSKFLIDNARGSMGVLVNTVTVYTNFLLGKYMVEEEQHGADRAKYGAKILNSLSAYLTKEYGRGFFRSNLAGMRKFYLVYRDRDEAIVQSQIGQLSAMQESGIVQSPIGQLQAVRLVILRPSDTYKQGKMDSPAIKKAEEILNTRGTAPRTYRNMLAFVAPDQALLSSLQKAVSDLLAWESIKTDSTRLNLDAAQIAETASNITRCNEAVNSRLKEVYCWLLVPSIDSMSDMKTVIWDVDRLVGVEPIVSKAANKMLQNEQIITKWAPSLLKMELDNLLWKDDNHIQVKKLWEYLTTYCYLPRLANFSVLEATIRAGVASDESFAIASGISGERHTELKYNTTVLDVYPSDYLVKVLNALKQIKQDNQAKAAQQGQGGGSTPYTYTNEGTGGASMVREGGGSGDPVVTPPPAPANDTRFFMSVKLDNTRVIRDLQKYLDEVITHLSSVDNCEVELSLEVSAQAADGFPQGTVRTVSENCRTFRVENFGFEK